MEENKVIPLLALVAGIAIGANWSKIVKFVKPGWGKMKDGVTAGYAATAGFVAGTMSKKKAIKEPKLAHNVE